MFHIILGGWIESDKEDFKKELEDFINERAKLMGKLVCYNVDVDYDKSERD